MAILTVNHFSQVLGMNMGFEVILPERDLGVGLAKSTWDGKTALPVMYLLHGASDDQTKWERQTSIERYVSGLNLAVVMPCSHLGAYSNQEYGFRYYDYIVDEIPAVCQDFFPVSDKKEDKIIAGLSMGGYGALKIGLLAGDRYGKIISLSPGIDRRRTVAPAALAYGSIEELRQHKDEFDAAAYRGAMVFFTNFGSPAEYEASPVNNLFTLLDNQATAGAPIPDLFMTCGTEDPLALPSTREFQAELERLGIPDTYYEAPGTHAWAYWDEHIQRALAWLEL